MSYAMQANIANDLMLKDRITACAASQGVPDAFEWAEEHKWTLAVSEGWVEAYGKVDPNGPISPGVDETAITDEMILLSVQKLLGKVDPVQDSQPQLPIFDGVDDVEDTIPVAEAAETSTTDEEK